MLPDSSGTVARQCEDVGISRKSAKNDCIDCNAIIGYFGSEPMAPKRSRFAPSPLREGWGEGYGLSSVQATARSDSSNPPHPNPLPSGERESDRDRRGSVGSLLRLPFNKPRSHGQHYHPPARRRSQEAPQITGRAPWPFHGGRGSHHPA